jgi:hypothetical protein
VRVSFLDGIQAVNNKVIKGSRPVFSGESYWIIEHNPPITGQTVFLRYRNGNKCFMNIQFFNINFDVFISGYISLVYNRAEYIRRYNLYTNMVKNAR